MIARTMLLLLSLSLLLSLQVLPVHGSGPIFSQGVVYELHMDGQQGGFADVDIVSLQQAFGVRPTVHGPQAGLLLFGRDRQQVESYLAQHPDCHGNPMAETQKVARTLLLPSLHTGAEHCEALRVMLYPTLPDQMLFRQEAQLRSAIEQTCHTQVNVRVLDQGRVLDVEGLSALNSSQVRQLALDMVAWDARIVRIERRVDVHLANRWASGWSWTSDDAPEQALERYGSALMRGRNQLLCMSDTGVQQHSPFFWDVTQRAVPQVSAQQCAQLPAASCWVADTGHRKFRAYWSGATEPPSFVDSDGHGTHVAGSALGHDVTDRFTDYDGVAPDARLVYIDLESDSGEASGLLQVPVPIDTQMFGWCQQYEANIHSGSWGGESDTYGILEYWTDRWAHEHRHFLPIFAAGNEGDWGTVLSPAKAKNALAVGATMNGVEAFRMASNGNGINGNVVVNSNHSIYSAQWLAPFSARSSGAPSMPSAFLKPDVVAPGGQFVWSASRRGDVRSTSSSAGQFANNVEPLQGTSMATPLVAGTLLLMRPWLSQLLTEQEQEGNQQPTASLMRALLSASARPTLGIYPRREWSQVEASTSAAVLQPYGRMRGEGFGRLTFDPRPHSTLPLSNENGGTWALRTGEQVEQCVRWTPPLTDNDQDLVFSVALVWTDPPHVGDEGVLVNDLDLDVRRRLGANNYDASPLSINGLAVGQRDSTNNVERARVTLSHTDANNFEEIEWRVRVHGHRINQAPQTFSLLVHVTSGSIERCSDDGQIATPPPLPTPLPPSDDTGSSSSNDDEEPESLQCHRMEDWQSKAQLFAPYVNAMPESLLNSSYAWSVNLCQRPWITHLTGTDEVKARLVASELSLLEVNQRCTAVSGTQRAELLLINEVRNYLESLDDCAGSNGVQEPSMFIKNIYAARLLSIEQLRTSTCKRMQAFIASLQ